ncbi:hypothetical protein AMTR_s00057p00163570 [Amborella trichopoda]|uniref:Xylanase inhibitor C-terminal domain-containing protein n=1 Tax=Amborella trichopoda TaxID=13333 RepID=U5D3R5_AMBTC|nr:hypothetical protein AMTR_s00057p00163570 [Amborella trichopoda]
MEPKCRDMPSDATMYMQEISQRVRACRFPYTDFRQIHRSLVILRVIDISVGTTPLHIPPWTFNPTVDDKIFVIDSGTSVTRMNETVFKMIGMKISSSTPVPDPAKRYKYCYRINEPVDVCALPSITFHFDKANSTGGIVWFFSKECGLLGHCGVQRNVNMRNLSTP